MSTKIHTRYVNDEDVRVPGVTTILKLLAKPALIHWAWKMGIEGEDYQKRRDKASDIGTCAHYMIECDIKFKEPDLSGYSQTTIDKAENAYLAWADWCKGFNNGKQIYTIDSELSLICDTYGGTLDWVIQGDGRPILVDFKTSSGIFPEMVYQLAAYKHLWNTINPDDRIEECYILRIGKEDGVFEQRRYVNLDREYELFRHLLAVYNIKKEIEGRI